ncbi:MAG TPA: DUF2336 domain-containing protein [Azospirillaceae bacterium]|nr:DUF2336 domain-containing protein [Azospirillaceae bacterium]
MGVDGFTPPCAPAPYPGRHAPEDREEAAILLRLMDQSSQLTRDAMAGLVTLARRRPSLRQPLASRPEFTAEDARALYGYGSPELRRRMAIRFRLNEAAIHARLMITVHRLADLWRRGRVQEQEALADHLAARDAISPLLLVQAMRNGRNGVFEVLFARFAGLDREAVDLLIDEAGSDAFAVVAKALGFTKPTFATLFLLARGARPGDKRVDPHELARVLQRFDRINRVEAEAWLADWQADARELAAYLALS